MFSTYTNGDLRIFSTYMNGDLRMFGAYTNGDLRIFILYSRQVKLWIGKIEIKKCYTISYVALVILQIIYVFMNC